MEKSAIPYNTIDEYIAQFPPEIQEKLERIRSVIKVAAPEAEEKISYQMPTFFLKGNLVHFAAHTKHIGFYPTPSGIEAFEKDLAVYKNAKGSVQFPIDQPMPLQLIAEIVKFRVEENLKNFEAKAKTGKKHNPFKIREFLGINPIVIDKLEGIGIKTAEKLLSAGRTSEQRKALAERLNIPEANILELVRLSDLARLSGVKGIRARLYYDTGFDSVEKIANSTPEELLKITGEFVERTKFPGIAPLPKEVTSTIENARKLKCVIEE